MESSLYSGRIACIGEAMVELMLGSGDNQTAAIAFAGDTLNTAIYLKRLLAEPAQVAFISALGNDALSRRMVNFIASESIDTQHIARSTDRSIGLYAIETDATGERSFTYWRSQSAARTLFQQANSTHFGVLEGFDVVYLSAITLAILPASVRTQLLNTLHQLRTEHGTRVAFDSNYRPALWESKTAAQHAIADAWRICDIALPSVDDEMALFDDTDESSVLQRFTSYGVSQGALKRGALGPLSLSVASQNGPRESIPVDTHKVTIVDTTAAGDSFNAGYLASLLSGTGNQRAMQAGHECSLRVIAHAGAIIPKEQW